MNISSAIVHVRPLVADQVRARLVAMAGVEVHAASEEGRFVVSIESAGDHDTADIFGAILRIEGVLSASLVYSYFESDPDSEIQVAPCPSAAPHRQGDRQ
jgi:nitrate reductase NapD